MEKPQNGRNDRKVKVDNVRVEVVLPLSQFLVMSLPLTQHIEAVYF